MPYTLMMFLLWGVAFFAIGVLVGWMLRALRARGGRSAGSPSEQPPAGDDDAAPTG